MLGMEKEMGMKLMYYVILWKFNENSIRRWMVDRFLVLCQSKFGFRLSRLSATGSQERYTRFIESGWGHAVEMNSLSIELSELVLARPFQP